MRLAAFKKSCSRCLWVATSEPFPGNERPNASVKQFIELAVNIPEHDPQVGQADCSIASLSASLTVGLALWIIASTKSSLMI